MKTFSYLSMILLVLFLGSCATDDLVDEKKTQFGEFEIQENNTATLSGLISSSTASDLEELLAEYPATTQIILGNMNSASSAEDAFAAARIVRNNGLDIHIADNSIIRKEATNFLLGGINRTKGENVQIGVSAWKNEQGMEATEFDFGHSAHLPWINFYVEMQYQYQLATDFYNFSIYAADADDIYFMSDDQLYTYDIIN